ncbi:MAG: hypothetical protein FWG68_10330 [Defluviitaleaceae bacterium]|nr:hypothetical protein [Defluviitaleaceae bacterium]
MEKLLKNLGKMTAAEIIKEIRAFAWANHMAVKNLECPQFVRDIYFLNILDFWLNEEGDVLRGYYDVVPHMIAALHSISAHHDATLLQKIYDIYTPEQDERSFDGTWRPEKMWNPIHELYDKMQLLDDTGLGMWALVEKYVEFERLKAFE